MGSAPHKHLAKYFCGRNYCLLDFVRIGKGEREKWQHGLHGYHLGDRPAVTPAAAKDIFLKVLLHSLPSRCFQAALASLSSL